MRIKSANLVAPAVRIAAAGLGGALGGPLGLALGATLGAAFGDALGAAAGELLRSSAEEFGSEAGRKLLELGGDSLADRLKPVASSLDDLCRKALRRSLAQIRPSAPPGNDGWFKNWSKCLDSGDELEFDPVRPDQLTTVNLASYLPGVLSLLDEKGGGNVVPRDLPPALLAFIGENLPSAFQRAFKRLIVKEEFAEVWKQTELAFRASTVAFLHKIDERTEHIDATTADTKSKVEEIHRYFLDKPVAEPTRCTKPFNLPWGTIGNLLKGRESEIEELEKRLKKQGAAAIVQPASITGMGGIGKTRLAIEYALRHEEDFSALLFVSANTPEDLASNIALLSGPEVLGLTACESGNQPSQYTAVFDWFGAHGGWLLIIDNVDTQKAATAVRQVIPKLRNGQVLIASRIAEWGAEIHAVGLGLLSEDAAAAYLLERADMRLQNEEGDEAKARELAQELGRLALALEQAAAYINARAISLAEYCRRWQHNNAKLLDSHDDQASQYPRSVAVTLLTSIDQLSSDGRRLFDILAWMAPEPVPSSLLQDRGGPFSAEVGYRTPPNEWPESGERAEEAVAELVRFSLVTRSPERTSISVHRLVQSVARRNQSYAEKYQRAAVALLWVTNGFNGLVVDPRDMKNWPVIQPLAGHARVLVEEAYDLEFPVPVASLMNYLGLYYASRAEWSYAEPLYRRALDIEERSHGRDHPDDASCLNNLARLLKDTSRLTEAEPLYLRALAISERSYGPDHPNVATCLNNLALLFQDTNRLDKAESFLRRALAINKKSYGRHHPNVAANLSNLALLLRAAGRQDEAVPLVLRALVIDNKSYGAYGPQVARDLHSLALLRQDTNRLDEAALLMHSALNIYIVSLRSAGHPHPHLLRLSWNYVHLLKSMGMSDDRIRMRLREAGPEFFK